MEFDREELNKKLLQEFHEEVEQEVAEEERRSQVSGYVKILVSLIVVSAISFTTYAVYTDKIAISKNNGGEVPLIMADKSPVRFKPEDPGGMRIPNRDKTVYNTISSDKELPKVVRIRPGAEEPIDREIIKKGEINVAELLDEIGENMPKTLEEKISELPKELPKEKLVKAEPEMKELLVKKQELMSRDVKLPKEELKLNLDNINIIPVPRGAGKAIVVPKKDESGFKVQLGSYKSENDVTTNWKRIKKKYPSLLSGADLYMQKADLGSKGVFYRLQVGRFKKESEVRNICQKLTEKKQGCFVVKN